MMSTRLEYNSFLIRLWREPTAGVNPVSNQAELTIQVEHILDGEKHYFSSLDQLFEHLRRHIEDLPARPS